MRVRWTVTPALTSSDGFHRRVFYFLLPSLLQVGLPFLILPFTTRVLTAADYGLVALVTGATGSLGALAMMGAGITIARAFNNCAAEERRKVVWTCLLVVTSLSGAFACAIAISYGLLVRRLSVLSELPFVILVIALLDLVASNIWAVSTNVCVLGRQARVYALASATRGVVTAAVTLWWLFGLGVAGPQPLFFGLAGGALVYLVFSLIVLQPYLFAAVDKPTLHEMFHLGKWTSLGGVAEAAQRFCERAMLVSTAGLQLGGIYAHAQSYGNMVQVGLRPVLQASWPGLLMEAKQRPPTFRRGRLLMQFVSVSMSTAGLAMALVGRECIGVITNGQFSASAPYAALGIGALMVRFGGRAQQAFLIAHDRGARVSLANGLSSMIGLVALPGLVAVAGAYGAVTAVFVQSIALLALAHRYAYMISPTPNLDGPTIAGSAGIVLVVALVECYEISFLTRALVASICCFAGAVAGATLFRRSLSTLSSAFGDQATV